MDFMKIIKSLELLLYELMVWLVFYPRTMMLAVLRPQQLMAYADSELGDDDDNRYSDTLSPPIFLAITLGLAHGVEMMTDINDEYDGLLSEDQNLIAFRLVAFSIFPLLLALRLLRAKGIELDRKTLRAPFYAQCYIAGPFALGIDSVPIFAELGAPPAVYFAVLALTIGWYLMVQARWFRTQLDQGYLPALGNSLRAFIEGVFACLAMAVIVTAL